MYKIDRQAIIQLIKHQYTTSLGIVTYMSAVGISKLNKTTGYPTIEKFTIYKLYKNMKDKMYWINESSVNIAVKRLIEQGFLAFIDEDKTTLVILNTGVGHIKSDEYFKSDGYITMHHFFFSKIFFDLPLPAKKLALLMVSRLNGDAINSQKINFKSKKNPETFTEFAKMLKINRLAHIKTILNELKCLFDIVELSNNTFTYGLNKISKALITGTDKLWNFTQEQVKKTEKILREVNTKGINFKDIHIKEITEAIKDNTMAFNRKVLKELCKNNRGNVKRMIGYVKGICNRLRTSLV